MKKILMILVFIVPLFLLNNVEAQNDADGFHVSGYVSAPDCCPPWGTLYGYIETLGPTQFGYVGPDAYSLYRGQTHTGQEATK